MNRWTSESINRWMDNNFDIPEDTDRSEVFTLLTRLASLGVKSKEYHGPYKYGRFGLYDPNGFMVYQTFLFTPFSDEESAALSRVLNKKLFPVVVRCMRSSKLYDPTVITFFEKQLKDLESV